MKLKFVEIENYRAIEKIDLQLDPQLTVLHGDNAHGKTSVLSAIALGLGAVPTLLPDVSGIGFFKKDRHEGGGRVRVSLTTTNKNLMGTNIRPYPKKGVVSRKECNSRPPPAIP